MDYQEQYKAYLEQVERRLTQLRSEDWNDQSRVAQAAFYSLLAGGKRVRAVLCMAVCAMLNGNASLACDYAAALEMLHCYSLIHDDLPCMDNDDVRRGKPSCHKAFDEATALLAGDALLTCAFEVLANAPAKSAQQNVQAVKCLSHAAGTNGMIWGQELDLLFENQPATETQLQQIHENKTGKLIAAAACLGAIAASATEAEQQVIARYAFAIGLVFQIVDDVLDVTADQKELGKPIGSDMENGKTTFVSLYGVERSMEKAEHLTRQACTELETAFGERSVFLQELALSLLKRKR